MSTDDLLRRRRALLEGIARRGSPARTAVQTAQKSEEDWTATAATAEARAIALRIEATNILSEAQTDKAVAAAMRYRVGDPLIDELMAELGMEGGSLNGMLAGTQAAGVTDATPTPSKVPAQRNGNAAG